MIDVFLQRGGRVRRHHAPHSLAWAAGWCALLLAGCSSSQGTITGKITYQGKPLPAGTVTFVPTQGGHAVTSEIQDGEYKVTKVPVGLVKIAVTTPSQAPSPQFLETKMALPADLLEKAQPGKSAESPAKAPKAKKPVPIPTKFSDPDKSGLTYTVKRGPQVFDIDLPDK
jgi:hypothetical protein